MRFTKRVPPTTIAPVEPAETKASALPSVSSLKATAIEQFLCALTMEVGSSCIEITSSLCTILSSPENLMPLSEMHFSMVSLSPVRVISTPYSAEAAAAPFIISSGALSPPKASITILIFKTPNSLCFHRTTQGFWQKARHSAHACPLCGA